MATPDPIQQLIDSRPQIPGQLLGEMPANRAAAITLMPAEQKLQVAEKILERMAHAFNLNIELTRNGDTLQARLAPKQQ